MAGRSDHPRSRGVYRSWRRPCRPPCGSSPLARGLLVRQGQVGVEGRIIPARAGFTREDLRRLRQGQDHPRSRGVYAPAHRCARDHAGSSPLARGLRFSSLFGWGRIGIIPARAGFTGRRPTAHAGAEDHPRSRGVYPAPSVAASIACGSSPLARGLPTDCARWRRLGGIIPARAGFTPSPAGTREPHRDHPRSRGVYK